MKSFLLRLLTSFRENYSTNNNHTDNYNIYDNYNSYNSCDNYKLSKLNPRLNIDYISTMFLMMGKHWGASRTGATTFFMQSIMRRHSDNMPRWASYLDWMWSLGIHLGPDFYDFWDFYKRSFRPFWLLVSATGSTSVFHQNFLLQRTNRRWTSEWVIPVNAMKLPLLTIIYNTSCKSETTFLHAWLGPGPCPTTWWRGGGRN